MNKQELIEELECIEVSTDSLDYLKGADYANERAINLAKQLDEPIKVVVPKFVAEWLDKHKYSTDIIDLFLSVEYATDSDGFVAEKWDYSGEFYDWLSNSADIQFTLCDAMRYGYEVEKEKLYYVKFDILYLQKYLVKNVETDQFYLSNNEKVVGNYEQVKFTEQEIKSVDERYWDFAVKVDGGE
ncbi:DUF1642 domain-containing protein [Enterococcus faecalis]|uniref:DUF1642 domain-containing protein n=1 Tax=Enterococcus faecalis TaxID=1351 RepID=UPI00257F83FF|nr:DUF1642 domain-containing protein [Enterococcus faecalis]